MDLDEIDFGTIADALEGDAVQLVLIVHLEAGIADLDITQDARAVGRVVAAEQAGGAFAGLFAIGRAADRGGVRTMVDRCAAIDDQTAPLTLVILAHRALDVRARGEDDRAVGGADGLDARTAGDHDVVGAFSAEQRGAGADFQRDRCAACAGVILLGGRTIVEADKGRTGDDDASIGGDHRVLRDIAGDFAGIDRHIAIGHRGLADRTGAAAAGRDEVNGGLATTATTTTATATRRRAQVIATGRGDGRIRTRRKERARGGHKQELAKVLLHRH